MRYILWLTLLLTGTKSQSQELHFTTGPFLGEPMVFYGGNNFIGGLYKDVSVELAKHLQKKPTFFTLPRERVYTFLKGTGLKSMSCFANPLWSRGVKGLQWSKPYMKSNSVYMTLSTSNLTKKLIQNKNGLRVGVIKGYKYSGFLGEKFSNGNLTRIDSKTAKENIYKLLNGKIDLIVHHELELRYQKNLMALKNKLRILPTYNNQYDIHCAWAESSNINIERVNSALDKIVSSKFISKQLVKYGVSSLNSN